MRQAIVQLEIGCVLPNIRVLQLESVILVEELEVPFSSVGNSGVIGIKRELRVKLRAEAEHTHKRQQEPKANHQGHQVSNQNSGRGEVRQLPVGNGRKN